MTGSLMTRGLCLARAGLVVGTGCIGAAGTAAAVAICTTAVSKRRERLQKHDQLAEDLQRALSELAVSQSKAKHSKHQLAKAKCSLIRHMARAKTRKAESARLSKAFAASEQAHSIQKACASRLEVAVAQMSEQSAELHDSLSAAQQELLDTRQELEAAQGRVAQLQAACNDQASRSEVLEKELLQLQQQAEDAEQAASDVRARYTAQMALRKRQYKAKVASLQDKQASVMESYIKLQRMYNRELQAKQQSEAMRMDGEANIKELQQQLDRIKMPRTCASHSTTSMGTSRSCSDSEFGSGCCTDDDGDGSEDDSLSAFQSDSTCDACTVLTPRGELARYDELIDELSASTCDIFCGGSNSNDDDDEVQATCECPTYISEFSNCGSSIDVAHVKAVNEFIDNYQDEPFCTCIATACEAAGLGGLPVGRLAAAVQLIEERMSQHSSWSAAAEDTFVHTVHGIVYEHSSKAATDDAAVGVQGMLNAETAPDLKDDLRSDSLVLSGAVWALNGSGPLLKQHDMQHMVESVLKLQAQCGGSDPAELAGVFEALQHLGMKLLPSPAVSEAGSSIPEFGSLLLSV